MLPVPQSFLDMPRWWGDESGRAWLAGLPSLVDRQCDRWRLTIDGGMLHGSNALVVPVLQGGRCAVLRLTPPTDDVITETAALRHWAGRGVVQLFDADAEAGASLLERLDPTRSLLGEPVGDAVVVLGELTRTLAVPAPGWAPSTQDIARDAVTAFPAEWETVGRPTPRSMLDAACSAAGWLSEQPAGSESVDGDLHFAQVLAGDRHPWTVVDPVLLRGDREYDIGRVLWTRMDELDADRDVLAAFAAFVTAADVPVERARAWVVVRAMSYLTWGLARGLTWDPPKCRRLVDLFV